MFLAALGDMRVWLRYAYPIYGVTLLLLTAVELVGTIGMGAQRWIDLGLFNLQPSELMKLALVLALARYFHCLNFEDIGRPTRLLAPLLRSEEHTSELQSLMRISYAVFCLKKKKHTIKSKTLNINYST